MRSRKLQPRAAGSACAAAVALVGSHAMAAPNVAVHAEGGAAHMVGEQKSQQFGWGGSGLVAAELRLGRIVGIELPVGGVGLTAGDEPTDPAYAATEDGTALFALPGLRLRPFGSSTDGVGALDADGLWIAGGGGAARTGGLMRPALDVRLGFDVATRAFAAGPYLGLLQVVEPDGGVRPEDGRVALAGLHATFDPGLRPRAVDNDRDKDGIVNAKDACPDEPEDIDLFEDADGCPDWDNDRDRLADKRDRCPDDPEDFDAFEDADGCPDLDNDKDMIADKRDLCPDDPEDRDDFEDADGCPDRDNDKDGLVDRSDACPNEPETQNGYADEDGCPDADQVRVVGNKIELDERVHFRINQSDIELRSWGLIAKLAALLKAHPEYELVHIKGHADDTGEEDYNMKLSEARARSVKQMLQKNGVPAGRLTIEAYGESRPREEGTTEGARHKNRRVEFEILERRREPVAASSEGATRTAGGGL